MILSTKFGDYSQEISSKSCKALVNSIHKANKSLS